MSDSPVEVSVVLPAYNEADTIETTVRTTLDTLAAFLPAGSFEVVVAEDGCEDETPEIADRLAAEDDRVRHFHSDERLGRGGALNAAFRDARGDTLVYFDTDLATDMTHLEELVESVRSGEYDLATGSRWMPGNAADRPAKRGVPSKGFNFAVRTLLGSDLRDHQCGFKAFSREAFDELVDDVEDEHWFWDTEMLVRAQREDLRVKEFAVDWTPKGDSKVDLVRDVFGMGSQILRCFWEFSVSPYANRRTGMVVGSLLSVVAFALMFVYIDVDAFVDAVSNADPALVAAGAAVYVLSWPLRGLRYRDILAELGYREGVGFLTGAVFISQTGNLVIPARAGDAIRAYVVKARRGVPYTTGFASLAVERVFDLLTITVLAGSVLVALSAFSPSTLSDLAATASGQGLGGQESAAVQQAVVVASGVGALAIAAVLAIVWSARSDSNYVRSVVNWASDDSYTEYVASVFERFVSDVQRVAADGPAFARVGASSVLIWTIDVATALLVFLAFGLDLALVSLLAVGFFAVSVGNLSKVIPGPPGGIGIYEAAFAAIVSTLLPVSFGTAVGIAIVDHIVKNLVTVAGGAVSMTSLNVSLTEAVDGSDTDISADAAPVED
ncbi:flippase-like domain-containing protein [Halobacterium litoreum]|uniref:Flippase-like domain-containing protein n=1 Tax=Halobacterium litoreum TaxID=2039234 RepID=A0ABD5NH05_9EURY|nr:flippase-like domain-containing protein [Halobacterium litoreum]UHH12723.1 flippase-like domain-containing protein [Halobacterium litoreum]